VNNIGDFDAGVAKHGYTRVNKQHVASDGEGSEFIGNA